MLPVDIELSDQNLEHSVVSSSADDLRQFRDDPDLNFGILTRSPITFQKSIDEVIEKSKGKTSFTYHESNDIYLVGAILDEELALQSDCRFDFYSDIMRISEIFMNLTQSKLIGIQLEVVENNLCRFFHTDNVPYRLITTYKGPTTEWLPNFNVNRSGLGKHKNEGVFKDESKIYKLPEFSLGVIKGEELLPGASLVHRSPTLHKEGQKRLIMRMDSIELGSLCEA